MAPKNLAGLVSSGLNSAADGCQTSRMIKVAAARHSSITTMPDWCLDPQMQKTMIDNAATGVVAFRPIAEATRSPRKWTRQPTTNACSGERLVKPPSRFTYAPQNESANKTATTIQSARSPCRLNSHTLNQINGAAAHSTVIDHIGPLMSDFIRSMLRMTLTGEKFAS